MYIYIYIFIYICIYRSVYEYRYICIYIPSSMIGSKDGDVIIIQNTRIMLDRPVEHNKPEILVKVRSENMWYIINFAVPMDCNIASKGIGKNRNYERFAAEARRCYHVKGKIVPIIVGALGTVPKSLAEAFATLCIPDVTGSLQTAGLLSTAAILRHVMNL